MESNPIGNHLVMTLLVSREERGHHAEYLRLFSNIITRAGGKVRLSHQAWQHIFSNDSILFMMVENAPLECFLVSLLRGLVGLRTAAILFKPTDCVAPRALRWRAKRWALMLLQRLHRVGMIVIIPFCVEPRFSAIARYGIYDPQLWDIEDLGRAGNGDAEFAGQITTLAQGRTIVAAMGMQAQDKGFSYFSQILKVCPILKRQFLFVSAGIVAPDSQECAKAFVEAGGLLFDRIMTEAEMTALYKSADLIWCCYAPWRDIASGIFGRAVQYGTTSVVRSGSYLEKIALELDQPVIAIPWDDPAGAQTLLLGSPLTSSPPDLRRAMVKCLRVHGVATILTALGLK